MIYHPLKNDIFIHKFDWELYPTTMLEWIIFGPFNDYDFLELISEIKC